MAKKTKVYRSLRSNSHMISRAGHVPVLFQDGLLRTSDPGVIAYVEKLADFGKGIKDVTGQSGAKTQGTGEFVPPKRIDTTKIEPGKKITVDSIDTVNEAQEFLVGRGVPKGKIMVKKDLLKVAAEMGIFFPALEAK